MRNTKKPSILVVDDYPAVRRLICRKLDEAGYRALPASTHEAALRLALHERPSLAVVDMHLRHGKDGIELCKELREITPRGVKSFVVSGVYKDFEHLLIAFKAGAVGFWNKPISNERMHRDIGLMLNSPQPVSYLGRESNGNNEKGIRATPSLGNVLVADDDEEMLTAVCLHLEEGGFVPYIARSGYEVVTLACKLLPDVIILDFSLPDMSGDDALRLLKSHPDTRAIPVLFWTGSSKHGREVTCLKDGAADYLVKGVHDLSALPVRIRRLLGSPERSIARDAAKRPDSLRFGSLELKARQQNLCLAGRTIALTPTEFIIMECLINEPGCIVSRKVLLEKIWGVAVSSEERMPTRTLDTHIQNLRKKLDPHRELLKNIPRVGYALNAEAAKRIAR